MSSSVQDDTMFGLRQATHLFAVAALLIAATMLVWTGTPLNPGGIPTMAAILIGAHLGAQWFRSRSSSSIAADALSSLQLIWVAGLACGFISLMGLRFQFPVQDSQLLAMDSLIGADVLAITDFIAVYMPYVLRPLRTIYGLSLPALFLSILVLSALGDRRVVWRATFGFVAGLVATCLLSILTPAKGSFVFAGADLLARVPSDAGRYAFATFDKFYGSGPVTIGLGSIQGIVCFPSFHTIVALLTAAVWKGRPLAFGFACGWCALVLLSTIPIGGHYVVDLFAGAVVWAGLCVARGRIEAMGLRQANESRERRPAVALPSSAS